MKKFLLSILLLTIAYVPSVFAENITSCNAVLPNIIIDQRLPETVSTIILIIKIVIPILLVIFGMLDLAKAVIASKEDEIKKGRQIFIKRLIAGALVFFIFTVVQLIISFVAPNDEGENILNCAECFINGDCTLESDTGSGATAGAAAGGNAAAGN